MMNLRTLWCNKEAQRDPIKRALCRHSFVVTELSRICNKLLNVVDHVHCLPQPVLSLQDRCISGRAELHVWPPDGIRNKAHDFGVGVQQVAKIKIARAAVRMMSGQKSAKQS